MSITEEQLDTLDSCLHPAPALAIPALIAEVRRLKAELAESRATVERLTACWHCGAARLPGSAPYGGYEP